MSRLFRKNLFGRNRVFRNNLFRKKRYGKKILILTVVVLVALFFAQPNVGSGVTEEKDQLWFISLDELPQKCPHRDCPVFYQAYCKYLTLGFRELITKHPALSKTRWAPAGTPLSDWEGRDVISTGFYAGYSSWPTRKEAFDDIEKSCPLFWLKYKSLHRDYLLFPPDHEFVIPYRKLGSRSLGPSIT